MLNERQLAVLEHLENQPLTLAELARRAGVSTRTLLRDVDYLNLTLSGKARITTANGLCQLEIFDRGSYFRLLQRHDNDDRLLAELLLNAVTTRRGLAEALNLPETWIADKLARLKQRYAKRFTIAARPGAGYFIAETEIIRVLILASLLKKDPGLLALRSHFPAADEAVVLAEYPDIHGDYLGCVIQAVYALRHQLEAPLPIRVSDALVSCVKGMGLSLRPPALQTLTAILEMLQSRARKVTPQRIAALLEKVRDNHPPAIIDATLIDNLTGHLLRCAATPVWLTESRQHSLNPLKTAWPAAFDMSIRFIALLRDQLDVPVFDSDLIGLYFACSLERHQTERQPVILLSDQNAIATINKMAIEREVLNCRVVIARSLSDVHELMLTLSPVCVINNSHFRPDDSLKNCVTLKNMIAPAGIAQIKDAVETAFIRHNLTRLFPAQGSFHYANTPSQHWDEIMQALCRQLSATGLISHDEAVRLCEREQEGENLIVNQLAIPHCWSDDRAAFCGYFITLNHPVIINHEPVAHMLIACASATARQEQKIFSFVASVMHRYPAQRIAALAGYDDFMALMQA